MSSEAIYFSSRGTVRFAIYPQGFAAARVLAEISRSALCDVFGAHGDADSLIQAYRTHFAKIQVKALACHCHDPSRPVLLGSGDFAATSTRSTAEPGPGR
jgi:hypothetical protein